jgi:hypothetical protein
LDVSRAGFEVLSAWFTSEVLNRQVCSGRNRYRTAITELTPLKSSKQRRDFAAGCKRAVEMWISHTSAQQVVQGVVGLISAIGLLPLFLVAGVLLAPSQLSRVEVGAIALLTVLIITALGAMILSSQRTQPQVLSRRFRVVVGAVVVAPFGGIVALAATDLESSAIAGLLVAVIAVGLACAVTVIAGGVLRWTDARWRAVHLRELGLCVFIEAVHFARDHAHEWGSRRVVDPLDGRLELLAKSVEKYLAGRSALSGATPAEAAHIAREVRRQKALLIDARDRPAFRRYVSRSTTTVFRAGWADMASH